MVSPSCGKWLRAVADGRLLAEAIQDPRAIDTLARLLPWQPRQADRSICLSATRAEVLDRRQSRMRLTMEETQSSHPTPVPTAREDAKVSHTTTPPLTYRHLEGIPPHGEDHYALNGDSTLDSNRRATTANALGQKMISADYCCKSCCHRGFGRETDHCSCGPLNPPSNDEGELLGTASS